jgi:hypothetical protein
MLSANAAAYLSALEYRADAKRMVSHFPLGGLYWEDEIPDLGAFWDLPFADRQSILAIFSIRCDLWAGRPLSTVQRKYLEDARTRAPHYPLFRRLTLGPDELEAQRRVERDVIASLDELLKLADAGAPDRTPHRLAFVSP